ncbi:phosphatase PAP2 family protein [Hyperthermus butylicus]|uniref:Universally conserved protein n=1 Tax=Hyperthermus butylicus (strain DSM 5456 / JCM 9403 / PLM1-5) TaxID=415426 RepID=A2BKZ5_HYPBU|nr:phosphatase PAP2 family protein [Hyperthermus butylicus]ABM80656.1 universally conserved protein [Hyperthermus butylicus DSM 5456]
METPGKRRLRMLALLLLLGAMGEAAGCLAGSVAVCKVSSLLGEEALYMLVGLLIYTLGPSGFGLRLVASLVSVSSIVVALKVGLGMPRPPREHWLVEASGPGFPSGHAALSTAFWLVIAFYTRSPVLTAVGVLHVAAVSYSRVVLGVHYPVDVVGGILVAVALCVLCMLFWRRLDTLEYVSLAAAASTPLAGYAAATSPTYMSAVKLLGIDVGLLAAGLLLLPAKNWVLPVLENDKKTRARLAAAIYSFAWLALASMAEKVVAEPSPALIVAGYALFAFNTVVSRPLWSRYLGGKPP